MDIKGAKALKQRLGESGGDNTPPVSADVPGDAPPVYRWTGVSKPTSEAPPAVAERESPAQSASLFRRLGLSLR